MEDLEEYLIKFADPTIADFEQNPSSVRHGFLACVVLFHAVDYCAYRKSSSGLPQQWRKKSDDFALIDKVADAFKHVATPSPSRPKQACIATAAGQPANAAIALAASTYFAPEVCRSRAGRCRGSRTSRLH